MPGANSINGNIYDKKKSKLKGIMMFTFVFNYRANSYSKEIERTKSSA
jgi:hypothetical protein